MITNLLQEKIKRKTILVVDDTPDNLTFISGLLKDDYRVKVANNGQKAITIARSNDPPDLILLDIMMPGMDGYDVCRMLKADPQSPDIPIIFLTAKAEIEDERQGLELGAVDYITKPVSPPILMARVKTQLTLKESYDNLKELLQFREDMVNMIVHDLRNPISNILLVTEMLLTYPGLPPERIHKNLNIVSRGGQTLRFLVDDLLLKAKSESNKLVLDCKNTDICKLCESAISDLKEIAARKNVQLIAKTPAPIYRDINIDPMLFRRAIDNLLSNAIKFSPQDSTVTLFVDYIGEQGVRIRVADFGPGVSENLRQSIFEKYEIGTLMKGVSQTGLGLAFCKIVVEAHSGKISVTDNTPQGSIFIIEIDN